MRLLLAYLAYFLISLLKLTWRIKLVGPEPNYTAGPLVFCFWHGRQAGLLAHPRPRPVAVLSSLSRDGAIQARILDLLGFQVLRGSSSRGGSSGLKGLVNTIVEGADAAFAVDGPRGPVFKVKPGAILAAQRTGGSVIPITTRAISCWTFSNAWDRYELPKPFARVELVRGQPIPAPPGDSEHLRVSLEEALTVLERQKGRV